MLGDGTFEDHDGKGQEAAVHEMQVGDIYRYRYRYGV